MFVLSLTTALVLWLSLFVVNAEISSGRIKGDDEPHIVSWRVLEGITEPFESNQQDAIPAWKQMKNGADQKAAGLFIQQALHEYGQLLRHPYMFGDMPMEERYDVFLSMSKLLKTMGFHQRAELLLYEAMSYTTNPHEAHLQLGLLFLDKEDLEKAKIHLKNCLFFKENDVHILIHLSVILIAEGRIHEAKFFLSRILSGLEARVHTLSFMLSAKDIHAMTTDRVEYKVLSTWVEDLIVKVFYGEFRFTPSATMDMLKLFSNLYRWVSEGELVGRFIFDLGQSLYEGGRPKIGQMMMKRGFETSDASVEGEVSTAIVDMRLALDYPVVPDSLVEIIDSYVNMTTYLSNTSNSYVAIDVENVVDLYWPLPLLPWSALPMSPVVKELMWRFEGGPVRSDTHSLYWYNMTTYDQVIDLYHPQKEVISAARYIQSSGKHSVATAAASNTQPPIDKEKLVISFDKLQPKHQTTVNGVQTIVIPPTSPSTSSTVAQPPKIKVEVGIFGGHMNNHPVGQMVFRRILTLLSAPTTAQAIDWREVINLTLLALPLVPDTTTKRIAGGVTRIVNLPMDTTQAWRIIQQLHLDVLFFPDWQPFPDQQSTLFMSRRMAPVQVCFYVRGSSCSSVAVDYYVMPMELEGMYYQSTAAAAHDAKSLVNSTRSNINSAYTSRNLVRPAIPQEGSFDPSSTNDDKEDASRSSNSGIIADTTSTTSTATTSRPRLVQRSLRPAWREFHSEQVVLLDWPILTTRVVQSIVSTVNADSTNSVSRPGKGNGGGSGASNNNGNGGRSMPGATHHSNPLDDTASTNLFSPLETEGRIFFDNQPVAVLPIHPAYMHPMMDDVLFKIMRAVPSLHVVLALPEMFFTHVQDSKHKISWARKLVRRLWARGGNLFHRIRLLPSPLSDTRLLQLLRQADMVLDTFPIGNSFYILAVATSVGTPVITLRSGTTFVTSKESLREVRMHIAQSRHKQRAISSGSTNNNTASAAPINPMAQYVMLYDLPYSPAISAICGYYDTIGLSEYFVANSTNGYFELASNLATNREFAYSLRVRLLEAVDSQKHHAYFNPHTSSNINPDSNAGNMNSAHGKASTQTNNPTASTSSSTMEDWEEGVEDSLDNNNTAETSGNTASADNNTHASEEVSGSVSKEANKDCGHCVDDLGRFILSVGVPYARSRSWRAQSLLQQQQNSGRIGTGAADNTASRRSRRSAASTTAKKDFHGSGSIS